MSPLGASGMVASRVFGESALIDRVGCESVSFAARHGISFICCDCSLFAHLFAFDGIFCLLVNDSVIGNGKSLLAMREF